MTRRVPPSRSWFARIFTLWRLNDDPGRGESIRVERVISVSRMFLAVIALFTLDLDPVQPPGYAPVARALLVLFAGHSVAAVLVLRARPRKARAFALTTFGVDVVAAALTLPMEAPNSPFFAFFLFVLASAAFRWGFRETLATTVGGLLLILLHQRVVAFLPVLDVEGYDDPNRLIVRTSYLVMMGLLLGYLAEEGRQLRAESAAIVHLLSKVRVDLNVTRALAMVANETVKIFNASHLLIVVEELDGHRIFRWDTVGGWSLASTTARGESTVIDRPTFFFGPVDHSMAVIRHKWLWSSRVRHEVLALDAAGRTVETLAIAVPDAFVSAYPFKRMILAPVTFGDEWVGRIFIFEPHRNVPLIELTEFLRTVISQISPAVFNVYLQNRLQAKAGALERARVARELHDGVIQSLIGVEMQMEVLRSKASLQESPEGTELHRLQNILRHEVMNLRDLMAQMRPAEFDPDELLAHFADIVQHFSRDTGIRARFITELKQVPLERRVCFELVRIVQEGLANIRKHSEARHAVVRFGLREGWWRLEIDDDGRGFPFEGRLTHIELDARDTGPSVIKERVRAIGGQLAISSTPGRGSRLEVLVPMEGRG
jgi:signal transduction histidine kinase